MASLTSSGLTAGSGGGGGGGGGAGAWELVSSLTMSAETGVLELPSPDNIFKIVYDFTNRVDDRLGFRVGTDVSTFNSTASTYQCKVASIGTSSISVTNFNADSMLYLDSVTNATVQTAGEMFIRRYLDSTRGFTYSFNSVVGAATPTSPLNYFGTGIHEGGTDITHLQFASIDSTTNGDGATISGVTGTIYLYKLVVL